MVQHNKDIFFVRYFIKGVAVNQCFFPGHYSDEFQIKNIEELKSKLRSDYCIAFEKNEDEIKALENFEIKKFN